MGLKPHQFRHRIDYAEDGIEPASCGFPKQVWKQAFKFPTTPYAMDYGV